MSRGKEFRESLRSGPRRSSAQAEGSDVTKGFEISWDGEKNPSLVLKWPLKARSGEDIKLETSGGGKLNISGGDINLDGEKVEIRVNGTNLITYDNGDVSIETSGGGDINLVTSGGGRLGTMPIGATYIQFPDMAPPDELFTGEWKNISSKYAGDFFRAEGGKAKDFQTGRQGHALETHHHRVGPWYNRQGSSDRLETPDRNFSPLYRNTSAPRSANTASETRPVNRTIRIWERTR